MELTPKLPPGRANRKALAFAAEIHRLRAAGYSFEAIRLALQEAGVHVSRTTVKREAARRPAIAPVAQHRHAPFPPTSLLPTSAPGASTPAVTAVPSPTAASFMGDARSGHQIAEAFMEGRISKPAKVFRQAVANGLWPPEFGAMDSELKTAPL
jgi:hypothetical protein